MEGKNGRIAIIGGGIGGLTLWSALKKFGIDADVFEKNDSFREIGAAISMWPNALRVFKALGLLDSILDKAGEFSTAFIKTPSGKVLTETRVKYDLPAICIHRADLQQALLAAVNPAHVFTGYHLTKLQQDSSGNCKMLFTNGEERTYDLIVGADGIHSVVRKHVLGDEAPIFRGYNIWRGVAKVSDYTGNGGETLGKGARFGMVPIKKGHFGWWAAVNEEYMQDDGPDGTKQKLMKIFGKWHDPIPELISSSENITKNSLIDRRPRRGWHKGNCVLLGDAAHPTTPNLGQGGCLAVEGAYILAACIREYGITENSLSRYEQLQYGRAALVNNQSLNLGRIAQLENPAGIFLRNILFQITPATINMKLVGKFFNRDVTKLEF